MRVYRLGAIGFAVGFAAAVASGGCGTKPAPCGPGSCEGCCDAEGLCQDGSDDDRCGKGGAACSLCSGTDLCIAHACAAALDAGSELSLDGVCQRLVAAQCKYLVRCGHHEAAASCADAQQRYFLVATCYAAER